MNLQELKDSLSIINSDTPTGITLNLVVEREDEETKETEKYICVADVSTELASDFRKEFEKSINDSIINDADIEISNISKGTELNNKIFYYDLDEFPDSLDIMKEFNAFQEYPKFSFKNDDLEKVKAVLITLGNSDASFTIYKHVFPITIVRQNRVLGLLPKSDRFEKLDKNILQINTAIDFLYVNQNLVIKNLKTFTNSYGFKDIIKRQAKEKIELIDKLGLISNISELSTFMDNVKYAKRVLKIDTESPVMQLSSQNIVDFIKGHPKIKKKIKINEDEKVTLDTDVSKMFIIGILNDAYLKSNLTDIDYESLTKDTLKDEEED
jgi:hypothetical protein